MFQPLVKHYLLESLLGNKKSLQRAFNLNVLYKLQSNLEIGGTVSWLRFPTVIKDVLKYT